MKVLITAYADAPVWTYVIELARGIERDGVQLVLAALGAPLGEHARAELRSLRNVEPFESTYQCGWANADEREIERASEWLLELAQRHDVDVVHLNELSYGALPWPAPPVVTALRPPHDDPVALQRAAATIASAAALVAPSHGDALAIQRTCAVAARNVSVIPVGRAGAHFAQRGKEPMIVATSDSSEPATVSAVAQVAARISWPVFVIGRTLSWSAPASFANTHFLGELASIDAASVLGRASVFMQPVPAPAAPYAALDAALSSCALVLADAPQLREWWDGVAVFTDPQDPEALRAALVALINDVDARCDLGARALQRALTFTAERMAAAHLALYIDLTLRACAALGDRLRARSALDRPA
ncbi:MAG: glycosyltransferase [Gemmatimonadota bacterium]